MSYIDEYIASDERLQHNGVKAELIANHGFNFERLMSISKGTFETHDITFNGKVIPMRLLSMKEERELQHQTIIDMDTLYPKFKGALYNINFEKLQLIKMISLATTVNPTIEACKGIPDSRRLTERDVDQMAATEFAYIVSEYQRLQKEYNPIINEISDEEINLLIGEILNPEKKSITISGLTLLQMRSILMKLSDILIKLEGNISITDSLIDISTINENNQQPKDS